MVTDMNHYTFEEILIGTTEIFQAKIDEKKMQLFAELSGDLNPMHVDREYAISKGYADRIAYGMCVSALYSTLVGMYLPGEKCLLNKCDVEWRKPVYIGDELTVSGEVVDKRDATKRIRIKGKMTNQDGITVNTAEIQVSFTKG